MSLLNGPITPMEDASAVSCDAGNPPVRFDVAGPGDGDGRTPKRARSQKRRTQPRGVLYTTAPVPDPTGPGDVTQLSLRWHSRMVYSDPKLIIDEVFPLRRRRMSNRRFIVGIALWLGMAWFAHGCDSSSTVITRDAGHGRQCWRRKRRRRSDQRGRHQWQRRGKWRWRQRYGGSQGKWRIEWRRWDNGGGRHDRGWGSGDGQRTASRRRVRWGRPPARCHY
jgi:hypothetical protein